MFAYDDFEISVFQNISAYYFMLLSTRVFREQILQILFFLFFDFSLFVYLFHYLFPIRSFTLVRIYAFENKRVSKIEEKNLRKHFFNFIHDASYIATFR